MNRPYSGAMGILLLLAWSSVLCAEEAERLGDGNDGNRSTPAHVIELLDETGVQIRAGSEKPQPFSIRQTCGKCHDYEAIARGWHFSPSSESDESARRPGEPWVLTDRKTRTQIPISDRGWPGTFKPEALGLSAWDMINQFGSHMPGGGYGEQEPDPDRPQEMIRRPISGSFEINCLTCHNADFRQDASMAALQAARQNFRWIPAASSGLAVVNGTASALSDFYDPMFDEGLSTSYHPWIFDKDNMVTVDITGEPDAKRCYFCHSSQNMQVGEPDEWQRDEDVHLQSGMTCTDCHRHGVDHNIARGIETHDPAKAGFTCEGCHMGTVATDSSDTGRLGAPKPAHAGIPTIHFETLTCTACHTDLWPQDEAGRWRTARMHKLGLHGKHKVDLRLPHVYGPVLMKGTDGKIGPHRLFWPSYWARMEGEEIKPLSPDEVMKAAGTLLQIEPAKADDWLPLTNEEIAAIMDKLGSADTPAVYIAGGQLYRQTGEDKLEAAAHPAAAPYAWPIAHDVRPAEQSLGVLSCADCHTTDSAFFFGNVQADGPAGDPRFVEAVALQGLDRLYVKMFNLSFVFRPWLKVTALAASGLIGLVLLAFTVKGVSALSRFTMEDRK